MGWSRKQQAERHCFTLSPAITRMGTVAHLLAFKAFTTWGFRHFALGIFSSPFMVFMLQDICIPFWGKIIYIQFLCPFKNVWLFLVCFCPELPTGSLSWKTQSRNFSPSGSHMVVVNGDPLRSASRAAVNISGSQRKSFTCCPGLLRFCWICLDTGARL